MNANTPVFDSHLFLTHFPCGLPHPASHYLRFLGAKDHANGTVHLILHSVSVEEAFPLIAAAGD